MPARRAIFVAPFDELAEPGAGRRARGPGRGARLGRLLRLGPRRATRAPVRALADPWVTLAAIAAAHRARDHRPAGHPAGRRRPHQLARETVTLDRLSGGRLVLGVGLGSDRSGEFDPERFGEEGDPGARPAARRGARRSCARTGPAGSSRGRCSSRASRSGSPPLAEPPTTAPGRPLRRAVPDRPARPRRTRRAGRRGRRAAPDGPDDRPFDLVVTQPPGTDCSRGSRPARRGA